MKLAPQDLLPALRKNLVNVAVLYGHHQGIMQGIVDEVIRFWPCVRVDPSGLSAHRDSLAVGSLFGQAPKVTVVHATPGEVTKITPLLAQWPKDFIVLVSSSAATCPPAISKQAVVGTVGCYSLTPAETKIFLQRHPVPITWSPEALTVAAQASCEGGWYQVATLASLACGDRPVSAQMCQAFCEPLLPDAGLSFLDVRVKSLETNKNLSHVAELPADECIKIVRAWQRHAVQVWQYKVMYASCGTDVWKKITPPVFFKHQALIQRAADVWSYEDLVVALQELLTLEVTIKTQPFGGAVPVSHFLYRWANVVRPDHAALR